MGTRSGLLLWQMNLCSCYVAVFVTLGDVEGASWNCYGSLGAFPSILSVIYCPGSRRRTRGYGVVAVCSYLVQLLVLAYVGTAEGMVLRIGGYLGLLVLLNLIRDPLVYGAELLSVAIFRVHWFYFQTHVRVKLPHLLQALLTAVRFRYYYQYAQRALLVFAAVM